MEEPSSSSTVTESAIISPEEENSNEPPLKKLKGEHSYGIILHQSKDRLESRLTSVLSCVVCFDLPSGAIYQCIHGHLMCTGCFNHLLADGRLKNEQATCPSCRAEISSKNASRNLAVEKAVSELPTYCKYCKEEFARNLVPIHEHDSCEQRPSFCSYKNLGCLWDGMYHQIESHEKECLFPQKTGTDLLESVTTLASEASEEVERLTGMLKMFSYEKIAICDVQLSPSRSDDYIPKLYYETNRFSAFDQLWMIKAKVKGNETSYNRSMVYQLVLKGKGCFEVKYFLLKGPFGDANIQSEIQRFEFRDDNKDSEYHPLILKGEEECNRLLAARTVHIRMLMFLVKK